MSNSVEEHNEEEVIHNEEEVYSNQYKRKVLEDRKYSKNKRRKNNNQNVKKEEIKIVEKVINNSFKKCKKCGKRLKLLFEFKCRCGELFCAFHRFHDQHDCSFNYREEAIKELKKMNPKIVHDKIGRL